MFNNVVQKKAKDAADLPKYNEILLARPDKLTSEKQQAQ